MLTRVLAPLLVLHAWLGTVPLALLVLAGLYGLYVVKSHLGIDIFPNWGLHLHGPRSAVRWLIGRLRG